MLPIKSQKKKTWGLTIQTFGSRRRTFLFASVVAGFAPSVHSTGGAVVVVVVAAVVAGRQF